MTAAYHAMMEPVVTAPLLGDARVWAHREVLKGERLLFEFTKETLKRNVFIVQKRKAIGAFARGGFQWRTLYVDEAENRIYALTPLSQAYSIKGRRCCGILSPDRSKVVKNRNGGGRLIRDLNLSNLQQIKLHVQNRSSLMLTFTDEEQTQYELVFRSELRRLDFMQTITSVVNATDDGDGSGAQTSPPSSYSNRRGSTTQRRKSSTLRSSTVATKARSSSAGGRAALSLSDFNL